MRLLEVVEELVHVCELQTTAGEVGALSEGASMTMRLLRSQRSSVSARTKSFSSDEIGATPLSRLLMLLDPQRPGVGGVDSGLCEKGPCNDELRGWVGVKLG